MSGDPRGRVVVRGALSQPPDDGRLFYAAPAPVDRRASFSGSGLPYASAEQAYGGLNPNRGEVALRGPGLEFEIQLEAPSAYYEGLGTALVAPRLHMAYRSGGVEMRSSIALGEPVPFRTLTYQAQRAGPGFYSPEDPSVRSQEAVLRASAFPARNAQPADFWGGKPAR